MKKLVILLFSLVPLMVSYAQDSTKKSKRELRRMNIDRIAKEEEEGIINYNKHFVGGAKLTTRGYGGFLEYGTAKSVKTGMLYQLQVEEIRDPKEEKLTGANPFGFQFVYGKLNFLYSAKLGAQKWINFGNKGNKNGVSVTGNFGGGLALGLTRPYELRSDTLGFISYKTRPEQFVEMLNNYSILEGPGFSNGWKNLSINPGIYLKPAIRFDYGQFNEIVSAIEIGASAEFFSKKVELMYGQKSRQLIFIPYVSIIAGKRK